MNWVQIYAALAVGATLGVITSGLLRGEPDECTRQHTELDETDQYRPVYKHSKN